VSSNIFWYISRTAALTAYLLFFVNIVLGLGMKLKFLDRLFERWRAADLHQFTALLGVALVGLHVFSLLGDTYYKYSLAQVLVPFTAIYRPGWTAWGIVGFYGLMIVTFSCYLRKHIGQKVWRAIHFASFGLFWAIIFHGIKTGTDITSPWVKAMYIATGTIVSFLFLLRLQNALFPSENNETAPKPAVPKNARRAKIKS
jgi:methionine sulfoxide reductase heme-binding subunit